MNLRLRFFLVPLRGLEKILNHAVLGAFGAAFQVGEAPRNDCVRGLAQQLLNAAQVAAKLCQRLPKSLVSSETDAFLLQGSRGIQHGPPSSQPLDGLFDTRKMWLCGQLDLLLELPRCLTAGFLQCSVYLGVDLFKERFRTAVQFVAVQCQDVIELRLKADKGVLLRICHALGKILKPPESFACTPERFF